MKQLLLRRAIELAPEREAFSYRVLAYLHAERGRWASARQVTEHGLDRHPGDPMLDRLSRDAAAGRLSFRANDS